MKRLDLKKIVFLFMCVGLILLVGYFVIAFFDTNGIMNDFERIVYNESLSNELINSPLYRYHTENSCKILTDCKIKRLFVFHNFSRGVMYVNYSIKVRDESGALLRGSHNVNSKWYIEKHNGKWHVTDIVENP